MKRLALSVILLGASAAAWGQGDTSGMSPTCPDANVFEIMMSDVCWDCMYPIIISGAEMGSGEAPDGAWATGETFCTCEDNQGVPQVGLPSGLWEPTRLVEIVRTPYCSPSLGGVRLKDGDVQLGGPSSTTGDTTDKAFYQYHYFAFPLAVMLDLYVSGECNAGGFVDMDLIQLSELDPLWADDELAFYQNPEAAYVANPVAKAACMSDAVAANTSGPMEAMWWCAGGWGSLYPFTGNLTTFHSPPQDTNLLATRALAAQHRRGLAWATMGEAASCTSQIAPTLPKQQYKWSQFYPVAEANGSHWIGESSFQWGEWRNIPAVGEDFVHLLWSWNDCCMR